MGEVINILIVGAILAAAVVLGWKLRAANDLQGRMITAFDRDSAVCDEAEDGWTS